MQHFSELEVEPSEREHELEILVFPCQDCGRSLLGIGEPTYDLQIRSFPLELVYTTSPVHVERHPVAERDSSTHINPDSEFSTHMDFLVDCDCGTGIRFPVAIDGGILIPPQSLEKRQEKVPSDVLSHIESPKDHWTLEAEAS